MSLDGRRCRRCRLGLDRGGRSWRQTGSQAFDDDVEDGREHEPEDGDAEHPGEDRDAHRVADFGAWAGGEHERYPRP